MSPKLTLGTRVNNERVRKYFFAWILRECRAGKGVYVHNKSRN